LSLSDALAAARGKVRDGVSAVENLDQLLGSRRVGPRQLPHAILGVQEGCVHLQEALVELEAEMAKHLRGDAEGIASVASIIAHAEGRVRELVDTLLGREKATIDARERLRLEAIVHRIALELDTVMRLTDLLSASATSRSTVIDLGDVLAERRSPSRSLTPVLAMVELRAPALVGDARIVLELLEFAVATVVRAGVEAPRIVADRGDEDLLVITIAPSPGRAQAAALQANPDPKKTRILDVSLRPELPCQGAVVRAAARRAGITYEVAPDGRSVTISL
jgi:hypothetical protein